MQSSSCFTLLDPDFCPLDLKMRLVTIEGCKVPGHMLSLMGSVTIVGAVDQRGPSVIASLLGWFVACVCDALKLLSLRVPCLV